VNAAHFLAVVKGKLISKLNGIFVLKSLTIKLMTSFKLTDLLWAHLLQC